MTKRDERTEPAAVDLSPLDPTAEPQHLDRVVARIRAAAEPELLRRRRAVGIWGEFARWRRGILVASGALAVASLLAIVLIQPPAESAEESNSVLGIPAQYASWIQGEEQPGPADLLELERSE
jgi:hypothetical protein